jgi:hypothetical protein
MASFMDPLGGNGDKGGVDTEAGSVGGVGDVRIGVVVDVGSSRLTCRFEEDVDRFVLC